MTELERLQIVFNKANLKRQHEIGKLTKIFQEKLHFMDHKIRKQLKSFTLLSICGGDRSKYTVDPYFQQAYTTLSTEEKIIYFDKVINILLKTQRQRQNKKEQYFNNQNLIQKVTKRYSNEQKFFIDINEGFRSWKQEFVIVFGYKITSQKNLNIDLRNYLIRKSKNTERKCHVLQAVHKSNPQTIRFSFKNQKNLKSEEIYSKMIQQITDAALEEQVISMAFINQKNQSIFKKKIDKSGKQILQLKLSQTEKHFKSSKEQQLQHNKKQNQNQSSSISNIGLNIKKTLSVCQEIIKSKDQQQMQEDLKDLVQKQDQIENQNNRNDQFISSQQKNIVGVKFDKKQSNEINSTNEHKFIKYRKNVFKIMLPDYILNDLESFHNFQPVYNDNKNKLYIYKNIINTRTYKMELTVSLPAQITLKALYNITLFKNWHPCIMQGQQKIKISSQNCSIFYQKHRQYSKWYRERDFVYLRHVFKNQNNYYIADKSIENTNFVPFQSITRGKINYSLIKISEQKNASTITMEVDIDHEGLLKQLYCQQLTLQYLKGFEQLQKYFKQQKQQKKLIQNFNHEWIVNIVSQKTTEQFLKTSCKFVKQSDFGSGEQMSKLSATQQSQVFFSIDDLDQKNQQKSVHQISEEQIRQKQNQMKQSQLLIKKSLKFQQNEIGNTQVLINQEGHIILSNKYIKKHHSMISSQKNVNSKRIQREYQDFILKDNWSLLPEGGLQLINKKKIQAQNHVFSFILQTIKKNIFSGKGALNISLPVQLFNCDSNVSRLCKGLSLGPLFLQKAAKQKNPIQRLKYCILFGISNTLIYLDCQKPFNPILGETFQGVIDGCPVYGQQISHHPPITSILLVGRGYRVYANLEAKVRFHLNSADGANQGWFCIQFDNGQIIKFLPPEGQVSGLTVGARKFNILGKSYYFDVSHNLYCQLNFQDNSGFFSDKKWKYRDQIQGQIVKINSSYMQKIDTNIKNSKYPSGKDILQKYSKLAGRWPLQFKWDDNTYYKPNDQLPFEMQNYSYPLNSNSFYRQDILYRKLKDLAKSQIQKQRLQIIQRGDRKLRQKYSGKKKH